jgi:hypothetical protein
MTRLHPDDIRAIAKLVAEELRRPVLVQRGDVPVSAYASAADLEAALRSEGAAHRQARRKTRTN